MVLAAPQGFFLYQDTSGDSLFPDSVSELLSESDVVLCEGYYRSDMPKVVIESSDSDDKTTSAPGTPVVLRTRIQNDSQGYPQLSQEDLDTIISYIRHQQPPSHSAPKHPPK